jgi:formate hydrogenlyase subunit 3/multisubunit Na+/H+ antiporter MnhD subunit
LPLVYLLRRVGLGVWLAVLACLVSAYVALVLPHESNLQLLGRRFRFDELGAYAIALLFLVTACLFVLSLQVPQGWSFYPFGLIILSLFTLAIITQHLGITTLIIEMIVLLSIFIIQGGRLGSVRATLRFLVMMTLAVPLLLLAAWQIDAYRPDANDTQLVTQIALLVGGGFCLWLGVAPLHGWLSGIAAEAKPGIAAFIFILFPATVMIILLHLLESAPWLLEVPRGLEIVGLAGLFTALVGGLFASAQRAFGPLMGYTALFDLGVDLVALGLGTERGRTVILFALFVRAVALVLIAASTAWLDYRGGGDAFERVRGLARSLPVPTIGLMVGGLTLAGAPFTAGFVSHWLLFEQLGQVDSRWPFLLLLGSLGVVIGYIRGLRVLVDTPPLLPTQPQRWILNIMVSALALLCLGLGFFPQTVLNIIRQLTELS